MEIRQKNSKKNTRFAKNVQNFGASENKENFQVGDIISVKITALGSKNIGVAEMKNGTTLLVPNTKCGEKVQVKIDKVFLGRHSDEKKKAKYALGTIVPNQISSELSKSNGRSDFSSDKSSNFVKFDIKVGQKFHATLQKKGPKNSGLLQISKNFLILVPNAKMGEKVLLEIQKIKENYAIAQIVEFENQGSHVLQKNMHNFSNNEDFTGNSEKNEMIGQEFHIDIPSSSKTFGNFFVVKLQGQILFVKKGLGVQTGDRVQIQIQKAMENFAIAKIQKVSPLSVEEKKIQVKETLQKMMKSSLHFGEKAVHCNANMRKFLWYRKKGFRLSPTHRSARIVFQQNLQRPMVKRGRHVFNVFKTQRCFDQALKQLAKYAAKGKTFLFVGTKKPAASLIAKTALLSHTSFFVNTRWLGGMLTNWKTILKSIAQIRPILKQKQKIQKKIFEKRQKIQRHLFQKVSVLRKKSQKFLSKGKAFIAQILNSNLRNERMQKFIQQKNAFFASNLSLVNASKNLKIQKLETFRKIQELEMAAFKIGEQKKQYQALVSQNIEKFNDFEKLLEIGQEFLKIKNTFEKNNKTKFGAVSSEKFESLHENSSGLPANSQIPNPSPELFKKMISILSNFQKGTFKSSVSSLNPEVFQKSFSNRSKSAELVGESNKDENKILVFSKFLKKFVDFLPFLQNALKQFVVEFVHHEKILSKFDETLQTIISTQKTFQAIYEKTVQQFSLVCSKLVVQRKNFKAFQMNFQQFVAEQRLLKFLPKFRYFPTSEAKMYETLEFFMKKFVDPKFIYPMEQIYDQKLKFTSKKIATTRKQKWQRLEKYFGGITKMAKMNAKQISKNVAIIVGQQEEMSAVQECRKLGMKIFAIVDTNCDPKIVDHIIPANDDSRNSIHYILGEMLTYIRLGQKLRRKVSFRAKMQQMTRQKRRFE